MKKMWAIPVLAAAICLGATACASGGEVNQNGANVFPVSTSEEGLDITMGDVMPFYDNGVMNIYHLRNSTGTNSMFYHPIARVTTTDFIHYTDEGIALNFEEEVSSVDTALGTGSFIKDENGLYHAFYTGHNDRAGEEGLPHTEVIRHATSADQKTWEKDEDFKIYGAKDDYTKNDFRDPYVYRDSVDNCYYMLITTRDRNSSGEIAVIQRYTATSLSATSAQWTYVDNFFENDEGTYNMECPSYIELNGYYYLAYSEQGDNRVTHYRYKTSHDDPEWHKFERDSIDASGFYAGRLEKAGEKLYAFAWCARLSGGSSGGFDWGGNLVTHELKQNAETGELSAVIPQNYKDYFSHEVTYNSVGGEKVSKYQFTGDKFSAYGVQKLSKNVTRMSFTVKPGALGGDFGLSFGLDGDYNNRLGSAVMAFELGAGSVTCYNGVSNVLRYGSPLATVAYNFEQGKSYGVDVIIDGEVITLYLNGEVALTARITDMKGSNFAFYSNGAEAEIQDIKIYE